MSMDMLAVIQNSCHTKQRLLFVFARLHPRPGVAKDLQCGSFRGTGLRRVAASKRETETETERGGGREERQGKRNNVSNALYGTYNTVIVQKQSNNNGLNSVTPRYIPVFISRCEW